MPERRSLRRIAAWRHERARFFLAPTLERARLVLYYRTTLKAYLATALLNFINQHGAPQFNKAYMQRTVSDTAAQRIFGVGRSHVTGALGRGYWVSTMPLVRLKSVGRLVIGQNVGLEEARLEELGQRAAQRASARVGHGAQVRRGVEGPGAILPGLVMHNDKGGFTEMANRIMSGDALFVIHPARPQLAPN